MVSLHCFIHPEVQNAHTPTCIIDGLKFSYFAVYKCFILLFLFNGLMACLFKGNQACSLPHILGVIWFNCVVGLEHRSSLEGLTARWGDCTGSCQLPLTRSLFSLVIYKGTCFLFWPSKLGHKQLFDSPNCLWFFVCFFNPCQNNISSFVLDVFFSSFTLCGETSSRLCLERQQVSTNNFKFTRLKNRIPQVIKWFIFIYIYSNFYLFTHLKNLQKSFQVHTSS